MGVVFEYYRNELQNKYENIIINKWFIWVILILVIILYFAYAFYCTSRGYSFNGNVKLHWPKFWEMGIGCKR